MDEDVLLVLKDILAELKKHNEIQQEILNRQKERKSSKPAVPKIPEGEHEVEVTKAEQTVSKVGKQGLAIDYKDQQGRQISDRLWYSKELIGINKNFMKIIGLDPEAVDQDGVILANLDLFTGKNLKILVIKRTTSDGKSFNCVAKRMKSKPEQKE